MNNDADTPPATTNAATTEPAEPAPALARNEPIEELVHSILLDAVQRGASDIHVEPYATSCRVRYRIGGVLREERTLPSEAKDAVARQIKILSQLDTAERRLPQGGRVHLPLGEGTAVDFRVSVLPTAWGETIVMHVLDKRHLELDLGKHGFEPEALEDFRRAIQQPWGLVLVAGPTGAGKTTTLYAALSELNELGNAIYTVEDPVEYDFPGVNQVHAGDESGLSFGHVLRTLFRHDPDVIMVGDMRDFETAEITIKAALTGHMVLSALHTNDAPATISRLLNMGIEPFLITASLNLILAQRLARKVCSGCKQEVPRDEKLLREVGMTEEQIARCKPAKGAGCEACGGSGYKGRVALHEVMRMNDSLRELILQGASSAELKKAAIQGGMITLRASGNRKILQGITTPEEVLRVTPAD